MAKTKTPKKLVKVKCDIAPGVISEALFDKRFTPIQNHLADDAPLNGCMFETYGKEEEFVKQQDPNRIWTYQDDDNGNPCFTSGWHYVNRIGYLICDPPTKQDLFVQLDGVDFRDPDDVVDEELLEKEMAKP
jgi:hypothetical protein